MSSKAEHQHSINASVEQAFANDETLDDEINIVVHWGFWFGVAFFSLVIIGLLSFSWFVTERMFLHLSCLYSLLECLLVVLSLVTLQICLVAKYPSSRPLLAC